MSVVLERQSIELQQLVQFLAKSAQNAAFRFVHRSDRHLQFGGNLGWNLLVDRGSPKSLPCVRLELSSNRLQRAVEEATSLQFQRLVVVSDEGIRQFVQPQLERAAALSRGPSLAMPKMIADFVSRDRRQPRMKAALLLPAKSWQTASTARKVS